MNGDKKVYYVVGDVHGCFDELIKLTTKIEEQDPEARFIFVGDWLDRGPKVYETLMWVVEHISAEGKYQSVRGNHDQEAIDWYYQSFIPWKQNTADFLHGTPPDTYYDFSDVVKKDFKNNEEELSKVIYKLEELPFNKLIEIASSSGKTIKYRIVHAWHPTPEACGQLTEADIRNINLYQRNYWGIPGKDREIYVHGHTPTIAHDYLLRGDCYSDRPGLICYRPNAINVDGGCCYFPFNGEACMLCAICLETLKVVKYILKILAEPYTKFFKIKCIT